MPDVGERLEKVEQGLTGAPSTHGRTIRRHRSAIPDVQKSVLGEDSASQIKLVAEVQAHHGSVLDQIKEAMEPLRASTAIRAGAGDHERRITALEGHQPSRTDARFRE